MRQKATFPLIEHQHTEIKRIMLDWANQFSIILFLDSNNYQQAYGKYECLLAVEALETINGSLTELQQAHDTHKDWLFGHITYDHKNELESKLSSVHKQTLGFPSLRFFRPRVVCYITPDKASLVIESFGVSPESIYNEILSATTTGESLPQITFQKRSDKQHYLDTIAALRKHIEEGDCYEINYCTEGAAEDVSISPLAAFKKLNDISPAPFAAYYRLEDKYMMCASPERYLQKTGDKLISQPIKGTARRAATPEEDVQIKNELQQSIKERAENVMIVDLTRNDLSRVCEVGSIKVEELFGIYTYPQVHQMISTVSGVMRSAIPFTDAIRYSFPMGSMTGAPKIKVMQLIEKYEQSRRELFSGTVGYITPEGDFDFNVIIRSLFYNAQTQYLSYQTGGAITYDSIAELEWDEMRLKAAALEQVFS